MPRRALIAFLLLSAPLLAQQQTEPAYRKAAREFERSLFVPDAGPGRFTPRPEAEQRPLFEAHFATLKASDEKLAFLDICGGIRYVYAINPIVAAEYCAKLLNDEDPAVRRAAVLAISLDRSICGLAAIRLDGAPIEAHAAAIAPLLKDADAKVRAAACVTLGVLHSSEYLKPLIAALTADSSDDIRGSAGTGLLFLAAGPKVAADARKAALAAVVEQFKIEKNNDVIGMLTLNAASAAINGDFTDLDTSAFADVLAAKISDKTMGESAVRALGYLKAKAHAAAIAALIANPDASVQYEAIMALDRIDARDQRPAIEKAAAAGDRDAKALLEKWSK